MNAALPLRSNLRGQSTAEQIFEKIGNTDGLDVLHNHILVAIYIRPEKTQGGIFLADQTIKEDEYQGKCGLVIKTGPLAFQDDDRNDFGGKSVVRGEWVIFRVSDGFSLKVNGVMCRLLEDVHIKLITDDPLTVY